MVPRNIDIRTLSFTDRYLNRRRPASRTGSAFEISSLNPITRAGKNEIEPLRCRLSLTLIVTTLIQIRVQTTMPAASTASCFPMWPGRISIQKPMPHSGAT